MLFAASSRYDCLPILSHQHIVDLSSGQIMFIIEFMITDRYPLVARHKHFLISKHNSSHPGVELHHPNILQLIS